jgi:hypothetical protein
VEQDEEESKDEDINLNMNQLRDSSQSKADQEKGLPNN